MYARDYVKQSIQSLSRSSSNELTNVFHTAIQYNVKVQIVWHATHLHS